MEISIIAAVSENNVIGLNGRMPWLIKNDLKRFKELTMGNCVIMGKKTYFSLGRKLENRKIIVLSTDKNLVITGCLVANNTKEALDLCKNYNKVFIAGGSFVYSEFLPIAHKIYLTKIHANFKGDTFMPEINFDNWQLIEKKDFTEDENSLYPYSFLTFERK